MWLQFLSDPDIFNNVSKSNLFPYASKTSVISYA